MPIGITTDVLITCLGAVLSVVLGTRLPDSLKKALNNTLGIAAIATILASNGLSIKNIGIVHNREFEEGVLRIEFYDESSSKKAAELLQKFRYIVYER